MKRHEKVAQKVMKSHLCMKIGKIEEKFEYYIYSPAHKHGNVHKLGYVYK